eukprot:7092796-Prymnesium_polylepis.1
MLGESRGTVQRPPCHHTRSRKKYRTSFLPVKSPPAETCTARYKRRNSGCTSASWELWEAIGNVMILPGGLLAERDAPICSAELTRRVGWSRDHPASLFRPGEALQDAGTRKLVACGLTAHPHTIVDTSRAQALSCRAQPSSVPMSPALMLAIP